MFHAAQLAAPPRGARQLALPPFGAWLVDSCLQKVSFEQLLNALFEQFAEQTRRFRQVFDSPSPDLAGLVAAHALGHLVTSTAEFRFEAMCSRYLQPSTPAASPAAAQLQLLVAPATGAPPVTSSKRQQERDRKAATKLAKTGAAPAPAPAPAAPTAALMQTQQQQQQQQHAAQVAQLQAAHQQALPSATAAARVNSQLPPGMPPPPPPPLAVAQPAAAAPFNTADLPSLIGLAVDSDMKASEALHRVLKATCSSSFWPCVGIFLFGVCKRAAGTCKRCLDQRPKAQPPLGTRPAIKAALVAAGCAATAAQMLSGG
jgi:hypothetical protein